MDFKINKKGEIVIVEPIPNVGMSLYALHSYLKDEWSREERERFRKERKNKLDKINKVSKIRKTKRK